MGKGNLAGRGVAAAAHEGHGRNGVVRRAEGALRHKARAALEPSGHGMDFGGLESFGERERRHDGRQTLGHHGLAGARRAYEQNVVAAGTRHLEGTLHVLLAFDLGEVEVEPVGGAGELLAGVHHGGFNRPRAGDKIYHLGERFHAIDIEVVDHGGLGGVGLGHNHAPKPGCPGGDGHGQRAAYGKHGAVERQLAHNHVAVEFRRLYLFSSCKHGEGDGQIVGGAFLAHIGRREVDDHIVARELVAGMQQSQAHALLALLHGSVGQTYYAVLESAADGHFHGDDYGVDALDGRAVGLDKHDVMI